MAVIAPEKQQPDERQTSCLQDILRKDVSWGHGVLVAKSLHDDEEKGDGLIRFEAVVSAAGEDASGDIMEARAVESMARQLREVNFAVHLNHEVRMQALIGRTEKDPQISGGLLTVTIGLDEEDPMVADIQRKQRKQMPFGLSIRFRVLEFEPLTDDIFGAWRILDVELVAVDVVSIPAVRQSRGSFRRREMAKQFMAAELTFPEAYGQLPVSRPLAQEADMAVTVSDNPKNATTTAKDVNAEGTTNAEPAPVEASTDAEPEASEGAADTEAAPVVEPSEDMKALIEGLRAVTEMLSENNETLKAIVAGQTELMAHLKAAPEELPSPENEPSAPIETDSPSDKSTGRHVVVEEKQETIGTLTHSQLDQKDVKTARERLFGQSQA